MSIYKARTIFTIFHFFSFSSRLRQAKTLPASRMGKIDPFKDEHQVRHLHGRSDIRHRFKAESALLKPLAPDAIAGPVPHQHLYHGPALVEKHEQMAAQRVRANNLLHTPGKAIKRFPQVYWRRAAVDFYHRRETQHRQAPSRIVVPLSAIRKYDKLSLPSDPSQSTLVPSGKNILMPTCRGSEPTCMNETAAGTAGRCLLPLETGVGDARRLRLV